MNKGGRGVWTETKVCAKEMSEREPILLLSQEIRVRRYASSPSGEQRERTPTFLLRRRGRQREGTHLPTELIGALDGLHGVDDEAREEVVIGADDLGGHGGLGAVDEHLLAQGVGLDRHVLVNELARLGKPGVRGGEGSGGPIGGRGGVQGGRVQKGALFGHKGRDGGERLAGSLTCEVAHGQGSDMAQRMEEWHMRCRVHGTATQLIIS